MTGRLVTEVMGTRSLRELADQIDREISRYTSQKERYSEQLGDFLRESEEKYRDEDWFKRLSLSEKLPKDKGKSEKKGDKKKKGKKKKGKKGKKGEAPDDWIPFQGILLSSSIQGEAELMFETIEAISTKIEELEKAKASIGELSNVGFGEEVKFMVFLREGVPEKIAIKPLEADAAGKFMFSKGFTVTRLLRH